MVSCSSPGTQSPCSNGALAGVFLYTGTGTELNVADGGTVRVQIMTTACVCDDANLVPVEYCMDWGDGTSPTTGTFPTGYNNPKNVELTHVYRNQSTDYHYPITSYVPVVTILTACGGVRSTTGEGQGISLIIYCHPPGTTTIPSPTMSSYKIHPDFNTTSCCVTIPDVKCAEGTTNTVCFAYADGNFYQKCLSGVWRRDYSAPCGGTDTDGGYTPPDTGGGGYIPPDNTGGGGYIPPDNTGGGDTSGGTNGGTDIFAQIMDFYNNNKTVSIIGIALLGGVVLLSK